MSAWIVDIPNPWQPQYIDHAESKNEITARILTDQIPKARIYTELAATQVTDNNDPDTDIDFATRSEDRGTETEMDMLISADLIQLPKGQAFALLEGGQLYKLRLPLLVVIHFYRRISKKLVVNG